ncbi:hypothetical protein J2785_007489 [Burkholderia ambifaria]|nr:hypothetical protein [Burkholderia ambifaria]MDR6504285.1 hypothetical protein [Burkholderia ambifaria]
MNIIDLHLFNLDILLFIIANSPPAAGLFAGIYIPISIAVSIINIYLNKDQKRVYWVVSLGMTLTGIVGVVLSSPITTGHRFDQGESVAEMAGMMCFYIGILFSSVGIISIVYRCLRRKLGFVKLR